MSAKLMGNALSALMMKHGVALAPPQPVPLAAPSDVTMMLTGYASTAGNVDIERVAFAPFAFGTTLPSHCPLLFEHDHSQPAGTVAALTYDAYGSVMCRVRVTNAAARRCNAFSIGARVKAFTVCNANSADFYAAH